MNDLVDMDRCAACGAPLFGDSYGGVCAGCLFDAGLEDESSERLGRYELLEPIDRGGTGIVYIARDREHEGLVALKIARPELLGRSELITAFRNGLRIQQELRELPNIVNTYEIDTSSDGRPYATMPLLETDTLAKRALPADPRERIKLVIKLARAVARAHQRGILHCDIKPANVLFNAAGEPYLSDFGFAHLLDGTDLMRGTALRGGTPGWMSPEQARGEALTTASDVFSLGVLLYWMLSQTMPFGGSGDSSEYARRVQHQAHVPLDALGGGKVSWDLARLVDRALHKEPEQRYGSATELADDLQNVLVIGPTRDERRKPLRKLWKWVRRHKLATVAALELALLIAYLPLLPLSVVGEVKGNIRKELERLARSQAAAVMGELKANVRLLEQLALEPEIHALVGHHDPYAAPPVLTRRGFDGLSVFTPDGVLRARWPQPWKPHPRLGFAFRDYFQGQARNAARGSREVYVARTFYSTGDEEPMLAVSVPLYDGAQPIGALIGRTRARETFGAMHMRCGDDAGSCTTVLLGPRDRDQPDVALPDAIYVLAAPGLNEGQGLMLDATVAEQICDHLPCSPAATEQLDRASTIKPLVLEDYVDPITQARSMAALAPVGRTGLMVVASTPNNALEAVGDKMTEWLKALLWMQMALGGALLIAALIGQGVPARKTSDS